MVHNCVRLFAFVILCYTTFVVIKLVQYIHDDFIDCKVTKILNRNCYEYNGMIYLEQYAQINENKIAFASCGKVLNCDTPCIIDVQLNNTYVCYSYMNHQYILPNSIKPLFTTFTISLIMFIIFATIHFIWYDGINIINDFKTLIYNTNTEYVKYNTENVEVTELVQINTETS